MVYPKRDIHAKLQMATLDLKDRPLKGRPERHSDPGRLESQETVESESRRNNNSVIVVPEPSGMPSRNYANGAMQKHDPPNSAKFPNEDYSGATNPIEILPGDSLNPYNKDLANAAVFVSQIGSGATGTVCMVILSSHNTFNSTDAVSPIRSIRMSRVYLSAQIHALTFSC